MTDPESNTQNVNSKTTLLNDKKKKVSDKKKNLKDPLLVQTVSLHEDIYALTWNALRNKSWEDVTVHDQPITLTTSDRAKLILHFLAFIIVVVATVGILMYESFITDAYNDASWPIVILRITLVAFAQKKLEPEVFQGLALFRYASKKPGEFFYPCFAKFVALCQLSMAILTFIAIFLFICMADAALQLIMNFAGLAVISELDDWIGEQIMSESIHKDFEEGGKYSKSSLNLENLNERMDLYTKICLIGEDMEIDDDQNTSSGILSWLATHLPWVLIPFLTIPCEWILLKIQAVSTIASGN